MTRLLDPYLPRALLAHCPAYGASPLRRHGSLWIKDETDRMGLGAFKALGGVYAVAQLLLAGTGDLQALIDGRLGQDRVFVCASAGNHGMAVAAGASLFGARARIYLAETVSEGFATRLRQKGAEVVRAGATYEDAVAAAISDADRTGAKHLADGSWPGYLKAPRLVMEGYTIIAREIRDQIDGEWPDVVYLQAGVGGFAAALAETIRHDWPVQPRIVVVEPEAAACLKQSHAAGRLVRADGPPSTMGRLDCKEASLLAFDILKRQASAFETVSETEAANATAHARTLDYDTTPSGAAGLAAALRGPAKRPLVVLTEGA